jgi:hypothetical protein
LILPESPKQLATLTDFEFSSFDSDAEMYLLHQQSLRPEFLPFFSEEARPILSKTSLLRRAERSVERSEERLKAG